MPIYLSQIKKQEAWRLSLLEEIDFLEGHNCLSEVDDILDELVMSMNKLNLVIERLWKEHFLAIELDLDRFPEILDREVKYINADHIFKPGTFISAMSYYLNKIKFNGQTKFFSKYQNDCKYLEVKNLAQFENYKNKEVLEKLVKITTKLTKSISDLSFKGSKLSPVKISYSFTGNPKGDLFNNF